MNRTVSTRFALMTAWRDARAQWRQLLLFTGSILAGIAALVAILSFRADVLRTVDQQARELLGADLMAEVNQPFAEPTLAWLDSLSGVYGGRSLDMVEFSSMVLYGPNRVPRLSRVRGVQPSYPLYGSLTTRPAGAVSAFADAPGAVVEASYLRELGLQPGDSVRVGLLELPISAALESVPGESEAFSLIGPRIYIPYALIEQSGLLQRGSQVEYSKLYAFEAALADPEGFTATIREDVRDARPLLRAERMRVETVESRQEDFDEVIDALSKFLGLIAFIALLLGGLGVGSSVFVYIRRRIPVIATLRCLGVRTPTLLLIYLTQIVVLGTLGGLAGSAIGLSIQWMLPLLLQDFLPFEIQQAFTPEAVVLGLGTGLLISLSFALLPILSVTRVSPLLALRVQQESDGRLPRWMVALAVGLSALLIAGTLGLLLESLVAGVLFTAGIAASALILRGIASLLMAGVKALRMPSLPYEFRQSLSNLHRPRNQTGLLLVTLGMGMLILGTMVLSRDILLERIQFTVGDDQPNLVLYDIQQWQNEGVNARIREAGFEPEQNVPIVSMRLASRKGRTVRELLADSTRDVRRWALTREYRVTYRDTLNPAETLLDGEWVGRVEGFEEVVPISISDDIQEDLRVEVGDTLTFDVQGVPITTRVASIRSVDFTRPEPNFFVLFPAGVLEPAPQFFATTVFVGQESEKIALQSSIVSAFPNVSAIDISAVLGSVRAFLDKISMAVQFMAGFSLATGILVLAGALSISRLQRVRESVLLRTIGASGRQIRRILLLEMATLGVLSALTGLILSIGAGWALAVFYFDLPYVPEFGALGGFAAGLVAMTLLTGWLGSRGITRESPLQILRSQAA